MQELNFIKKYKKNSQPHYLYIRLPQVNDRNFLRPFSERVKHIFEIQLITDVSTLFFFTPASILGQWEPYQNLSTGSLKISLGS